MSVLSTIISAVGDGLLSVISTIGNILSSIDFWKITAPAMFASAAWFINEKKKREWEQWQMKKAACVKALNVANAIISSRSYDKVPREHVTPQYETIDNVRACFNELATSCDKAEVFETLKEIVLSKTGTPADIVTLRNAVRRELKFGSDEIDKDIKRAFIGRVSCQPPAP